MAGDLKILDMASAMARYAANRHQILAQNMQSALQGGAAAGAGAAAAAPAGVKPEDVMATLEKLGELKAKGILTDDEFNTKKAELLKKLV